MNLRRLISCVAVMVCAASPTPAQAAPLSISTQTLPQATSSTAYTTTLSPAGGTSDFKWTLSSRGALPTTMTLSATGVLSGSVSASGTYAFTAQVSDASKATSSKVFSLKVVPYNLKITTSSPLPKATAGIPYSAPLAATGGKPPYTWSLTSTPAVTGIVVSGGTLAGKRNQAGDYALFLKVTDANAMSVEAKVMLTVVPYGLGISGPSAIAAIREQEMTPRQFSPVGGIPPYKWSVSPPLPLGLTLNASSGLLSGTAVASAGSYAVVIKVNDGNAQPATQNCTITLASAPVSWTKAATLPAAKVGASYADGNLGATGGKPPYTYSVKAGSTLPANMLLSSGGITGTPTAAGSYTFTLVVNDAQSPPQSAQRIFNLVVDKAVDLSMVTVAGGAMPQGSAFAGQTLATFQIGNAEVTWAEWKQVRTWAVANGYADLANVGAGSGDNYPVTDVSWYDVVKWCNAKSQKENKTPVYTVNGAPYKSGTSVPVVNTLASGYRLPTEPEWERAAGGGTKTHGYTYSGSNDVSAVAWHMGNSGSAIKPVGTKVANELGLYDMSGNVWEWCWDAVSASSNRRIRGGAWNSSDGFLGVTHRNYGDPAARSSAFGFRLACSTPVPTSVMVQVEAGTLSQGSALASQTVGFFAIGKTEVSWGEWKAVRDWAVNNNKGYDLAGVGSTYPEGKGDDFPVTNVSWYQVVKWCNAKSEMENKAPVYMVNGAPYKSGAMVPVVGAGADGYRLPTEKEWEWAARGGSSSRNYTYSGSNSLDAVAWSAGNGSVGTKAVGTKGANELGIYDMSGNAWEWCWDADSTGLNRCIRGGDFESAASVCNVSTRTYVTPGLAYGGTGFGFRLARSSEMVTVLGGKLPASSTLGNQTVTTFEIGRTEVTWAEWQRVRTYAVAHGYDLSGVGSGTGEAFPVGNVSWYHVVKWCNAKSEMENKTPVYTVKGATYKSGEMSPVVGADADGYRLPTEKEWEWAARGGLSSHNYRYSGSDNSNLVAWTRDNTFIATKAVATKAANELGIYDMSGNVWEWCETVYQDGDRGVRGGSSEFYSPYCTVGFVDSGAPVAFDSFIGFRLARSLGN